MKINRFEDIQAWQQSRILTKEVYQICHKNTSAHKDIRFKSQITGSAVSIMSNIAEGFSRGSNKEFVRFLFISKASIAELQSQLYIALDQRYITQCEFDKTYSLCEKVARYISKLITYLKNSTNSKNATNTKNAHTSNPFYKEPLCQPTRS